MTSIVVASRAIVINDQNQIVLVKIKDGYWCLPGGLLEPNESLTECAKREVYEETGYKIAPKELFWCYEFYDERFDSHRVEHCFLSSVIEAPKTTNWQDLGEDQSVTEHALFTFEAIQSLDKVYPEILKQQGWEAPNKIYLGRQ